MEPVASSKSATAAPRPLHHSSAGLLLSANEFASDAYSTPRKAAGEAIATPRGCVVDISDESVTDDADASSASLEAQLDDISDEFVTDDADTSIPRLEAQLAALQSEYAMLLLERQRDALQEQLTELRSSMRFDAARQQARPEISQRTVRFADDLQGGRLSEPIGTSPRQQCGEGVVCRLPARSRGRPAWRRHIHGSATPVPKLSRHQIEARGRLIGQQVKVLNGPDANLRGTLTNVLAGNGYATIVLLAAGANVYMPPRVAADPAARFAGQPRRIYSASIAPIYYE